MFFQSWQLWEKMSFVLGMALVTVVVFGWVKLVWRIRLMKKQEVMDEEKRAKRQELRASIQRGEARGKHEIPFGIRAIQSGIQVDGIWISNPNTPVPSELTLSSIHGESSDDLSKSSTKPISKVTPQTRSKPSIRVRQDNYGCYRAKSESLQEILEGKTTRTSYKPRRSSHLRFEGQGDGIGDPLDHLEDPTLSRKKTTSPRFRRYPSTDRDPDSSAADNERNSGTSDESDATLSQEPSTKSDWSKLNNLNAIVDDNTEKTLINESPPLPEKSLDEIHDSKIDTTPSTNYIFHDIAPSFLQPTFKENKEQNSNNFKVEPSRIHSPNPFKPGELHMNKNSRKVNTGFEVLPAGTFGIPVEFNTDSVDSRKKQDATDKRPPAKLQKKPPDLTSQRTGINEE